MNYDVSSEELNPSRHAHVVIKYLDKVIAMIVPRTSIFINGYEKLTAAGKPSLYIEVVVKNRIHQKR